MSHSDFLSFITFKIIFLIYYAQLIYCIVNGNESIKTMKDKFLIGSNVSLKLQGEKDLEKIKKLSNASLYSLDLSFNQNTFESYFEDINQLEMLKILNMSHNKNSIIRERQFNGLVELEVLDLSYNEIFYFEENAFHGDVLNKLIDLNLKKKPTA